LDKIIAPHVLRDAPAHGQVFMTAEPFRHVVIDDFFIPAYLDRVNVEFPSFERGNARTENGDLGNKSTVEKIRDLGASFAALDDLIQSKDFLDLVGRLTGIDGLLYDPWYFGGGTHESRHGQDLDAHVDFNRHPIENWHRRLNLIVYLNHEWDDDWGGALELHSDPRAADNRTMRITPRSNRCVIFETTESSWHGFPPIVLPESKRHLTRRSIALYFYTKERPAEQTAGRHTTHYVGRPLPERFQPGHVLDAADVADRIFASAVAKGVVKQDDFEIVWSSKPIPESPMVWRKALDPELKKKVADALASIKDVPWGDQGVLNGFQPTTDASYDVVRETAKVLDLDLRSMK
jgi:hypothetical protein